MEVALGQQPLVSRKGSSARLLLLLKIADLISVSMLVKVTDWEHSSAAPVLRLIGVWVTCPLTRNGAGWRFPALGCCAGV